MSESEKKRPGPKPSKKLTKGQERVMTAIRAFVNQHGLPPTVQELADILSIQGPSVHEQIHHLVRKGYLRRPPFKTRAIEIVDMEPPPKLPSIGRMVPVPIVGKVAAGLPILAVENRIGEFQMEAHLAQGKCFALEIVGDSMVEAQINEGDFIIVRQQQLESGYLSLMKKLNSDRKTLNTIPSG